MLFCHYRPVTTTWKLYRFGRLPDVYAPKNRVILCGWFCVEVVFGFRVCRTMAINELRLSDYGTTFTVVNRNNIREHVRHNSHVKTILNRYYEIRRKQKEISNIVTVVFGHLTAYERVGCLPRSVVRTLNYPSNTHRSI